MVESLPEVAMVVLIGKEGACLEICDFEGGKGGGLGFCFGNALQRGKIKGCLGILFLGEGVFYLGANWDVGGSWKEIG